MVLLNPQLSKELKNKVNVPLAAGERIYSRYGFKPFLENRSLDVIQPDIATCGGIPECKKICDMARIYDILVQPHVCGGPILSDFTRSLGVYDDQPVNAYITVPDRPGLGQGIPADILAKCSKKNSLIYN